MKHRAPIFALVAVLLLGAAFYFLMWRPKDEELEEVRAETAQLETRRSELQNELRRLEEIEARQVEFRAALARLEEYIPSGPAQSTAIRQFQVAADAAGVTIASVSFSEPSVVDGAPETGQADTVLAGVEVAMNVEGGYFQVVDFFRRIEVDVPRAVLMSALGISEAQDEFPLLSTNWNGQLFTVIPDPVLVGADPEPPAPENAEGEAGEDVDGEDAVDAEADGADIQASGELEDQS